MILSLALLRHSARFIDREAILDLGFNHDPMTSIRALKRRGLIYPPKPRKAPGIYQLTEAGEHVYQLCVIAGLLDSFTEKLKEIA